MFLKTEEDKRVAKEKVKVGGSFLKGNSVEEFLDQLKSLDNHLDDLNYPKIKNDCLSYRNGYTHKHIQKVIDVLDFFPHGLNPSFITFSIKKEVGDGQVTICCADFDKFPFVANFIINEIGNDLNLVLGSSGQMFFDWKTKITEVGLKDVQENLIPWFNKLKKAIEETTQHN